MTSDWHQQAKNHFKNSYPKPLLGAIRNSCFSKEELAEKLEITLEEFEQKVSKKISWNDRDKSILCLLLHIPAHYAADWFGE